MLDRSLKVACLYTIVNSVNGHRYFGSTVDFRARVFSHLSDLRRGKHMNSHLQRAWNKYGEPAFKFGIVCIVEDVQQLLDCEQAWLDNWFPEYNMCHEVRSSRLGIKCSSETIAKMRSSKAFISEDTRNRIRNARLGTKASPETKLKMSLKRAGVPLSSEHRRRISAGLKGVPKSESHKAKLSMSQHKHQTRKQNQLA